MANDTKPDKNDLSARIEKALKGMSDESRYEVLRAAAVLYLEHADPNACNESELCFHLWEVNQKRCEPPLPLSKFNAFLVATAEELLGRTISVWPGMFEDEHQLATDLGFGKHFVRVNGMLVRFNSDSGDWLTFEAGVWRAATSDVAVQRLFKEQWLAHIRRFLEELPPDITELLVKKFFERKKLTKQEEGQLEPYEAQKTEVLLALQAQEVKQMTNALKMARSEHGIEVRNEDLDRYPLIFNAQNLALDLETSQMRPNRVELLLTKQAKVDYVPESACPRFEAILARSLPDESVRQYMQDFFGLCLSGVMTPDIVILLGLGANGKSLLISIMAGVLGNFYGKAAMTTFVVTKHPTPGGARSDLAALRGKRLVTASEANRRVTLDLETLKDWSGGEVVNARDLWERARNAEFQPQAKLLLAMNHPPKIIDQSEGAWRRLKYVKFDVVIPPEERNDKLAREVIETEGSGILSWCLKGWERVRERLEAGRPCLSAPQKITDDTLEFREQENALVRFFEERLEIKSGKKQEFAPAYRSYTSWCEDNHEYQESTTEFTLALKRWNDKIETCRLPNGQRGFSGAILRHSY